MECLECFDSKNTCFVFAKVNLISSNYNETCQQILPDLI